MLETLAKIQIKQELIRGPMIPAFKGSKRQDKQQSQIQKQVLLTTKIQCLTLFL